METWSPIDFNSSWRFHRHHHDAKHSAVASRHCDLSPKRAFFCQLQSIGHWYSCVPADLMDPEWEVDHERVSNQEMVGHRLGLRSKSEGSGLLGRPLWVWQHDRTVRVFVCERWKRHAKNYQNWPMLHGVIQKKWHVFHCNTVYIVKWFIIQQFWNIILNFYLQLLNTVSQKRIIS